MPSAGGQENVEVANECCVANDGRCNLVNEGRLCGLELADKTLRALDNLQSSVVVRRESDVLFLRELRLFAVVVGVTNRKGPLCLYQLEQLVSSMGPYLHP